MNCLCEKERYTPNEPVPPVNCSLVRDSALLLFLGSNGIAFTEVFPRPVIRIRDVDVLTIDKNDDGSLAVSAIIKDRDGRILTEIKHGKFVVAQGERIFKRERPSRSELKVTDEYGDVVLYLKFFNPRAMWITFKSHGFEFHGSKLQNNQTCFGGRGRANQPMIWMFPPPPEKLRQAIEAPKSAQ